MSEGEEGGETTDSEGGEASRGCIKTVNKDDKRIKRKRRKEKTQSIQMGKPHCQDSKCFTVLGKVLWAIGPAQPRLTRTE